MAGLFLMIDWNAGLLRDAQLTERGPDRVERGDDLARTRQHVELVRAARAVLQNRRGGVGGRAGIRLDRIDCVEWVALGVRGALQIVAQELLTVVDQARELAVAGAGVLSAAVTIDRPPILGIQTVGQDDDDPVVDGVGVLRRRGHGTIRQQALPRPGQSDRLVGAAGRLHRIDGALQRGPAVAQRHDRLQRC